MTFFQALMIHLSIRLRRLAYRIVFVAGPVLLWCALAWTGFVEQSWVVDISMWVAVILFILALPCSLFLYAATEGNGLSLDRPALVIFLLLLVAVVNAVLLSVLRGLLFVVRKRAELALRPAAAGQS